MGSKIFWFLILVALCVSGYFMYDHYHQEKMMGNGDVTWVTGQPSPEEHARFLKENSGETADGQSERKIQTATDNPTPAAADSATAATATPAATPATAPQAEAQPQPDGAYTATAGAAPANLPASDSVPPNPANGARFSGSGAYQWYRQGNLTWRVDTVSGRSCIDYATMEEWRKPIVSSHGCGRGA